MTAQENETARLEAFSDGIFAFAITLLTLDIHVPEANKLPLGGLGAALLAQWPSYLAYATSFATILIMWINHDRLFEHIQKKDRLLVLLNGFLLMIVTLVPFATSLLARYIELPGAKIAAAVFNGTYLLMAYAFNLLWRHAAKGGRLLAEDHDRQKARKITEQYRYGPLLYVAAFVLAFINVNVTLVANIALAIFFALPEKPDKKNSAGSV